MHTWNVAFQNNWGMMRALFLSVMLEEQLSVQIVSSLLKLAFLVLQEYTYLQTTAKLESASPNTGTGDFSSAFDHCHYFLHPSHFLLSASQVHGRCCHTGCCHSGFICLHKSFFQSSSLASSLSPLESQCLQIIDSTQLQQFPVHSDITSLPLHIIMVLFMQSATKTPEL